MRLGEILWIRIVSRGRNCRVAMLKVLSGSFVKYEAGQIVVEASKTRRQISMKFSWSVDFANQYRRRFCRDGRTGGGGNSFNWCHFIPKIIVRMNFPSNTGESLLQFLAVLIQVSCQSRFCPGLLHYSANMPRIVVSLDEKLGGKNENCRDIQVEEKQASFYYVFSSTCFFYFWFSFCFFFLKSNLCNFTQTD